MKPTPIYNRGYTTKDFGKKMRRHKDPLNELPH